MTIASTASPSAFDFRTRLRPLDGLRGLAILSVFFYHYAGGNTHATSLPLRVVAAVFGLGWTGVDLFFVLSGFLITGILYDTQDDPCYYRNFYLRRMLRIFPVYYFAAAMLLVLTPFIHAHWTAGHLLFLLYLGYPASLFWPSLTHFSSVILITHVWSLSVEEQFYMVWPWLVARMRTRRGIATGCLAVGLIAIASRCLFSAWPGLSPTWSYTFLLCRADQLALGAAIAMGVRSRWRDHLLRSSPYALMLFSALVAVLCGVRHTVDHSDPVVSSVGYTAIALAYGSLLLCCLRPHGIAQRIFSPAPLRLLGKYSYGFYLYHFPLSYFMAPLKDQIVSVLHSYALGSFSYLAVCLAANLLLAAASFHILESPIMSLKERFRYRSEQRVASIVAPEPAKLVTDSVPWTYPSSS